MEDKTLFQKIADREIPAEIVYEDEWSVAFRDINPQAPTHILVIPRKPIPAHEALTEEDKTLLGHLHLVAKKVAEQEGLTRGYRLVINNGPEALQTVPHLHMHLIGGRKMSWPPG